MGLPRPSGEPVDKHPSGLTWERWNNPFKTPEERKLVVKYFRRIEKDEKQRAFDELEPAPF
jgi:hypothetical protein